MKNLSLLRLLPILFIITHSSLASERELDEGARSQPISQLSIKPYTKLEVSGHFTVQVSRGNDYSLRVEGDPQILKYLKTQSEYGTLRLSLIIDDMNTHKISSYSSNSDCTNINHSNQGGKISLIESEGENYLVMGKNIYKTSAQRLHELLKVIITVPHIERITLNNHSRMYLDLKHSSDKQLYKYPIAININRHSYLNSYSLRSKYIEVNVTDHGTAEFQDISCDKLKLSIDRHSTLISKNIRSTMANISIDRHSSLQWDSLTTKDLYLTQKSHSISNGKSINFHRAELYVEAHSKADISSMNGDKFRLKLYNLSILNVQNGKIKEADLIIEKKSKLNTNKLTIDKAHLIAKGLGSAMLNIIDQIRHDVSDMFNLIVEGTPKIIKKGNRRMNKKKGKRNKN